MFQQENLDTSNEREQIDEEQDDNIELDVKI